MDILARKGFHIEKGAIDVRKNSDSSRKVAKTAIEAAAIWVLLALLFVFAGAHFSDKPYWYLFAAVAISAIPAAAYYFFCTNGEKFQIT